MTRGVKLAIASVAVLWVGGMVWWAWKLLDELPSPERGAGLLYFGGGGLGGLAFAALVAALGRWGLGGSDTSGIAGGIGAGIGVALSGALLRADLSSFTELALIGVLGTTALGLPLFTHLFRDRPPQYLIGPGARRR